MRQIKSHRTNINLKQQLIKLLTLYGVDKIGFADLTDISGINYQSGISILVKLNPDIVSEIKNGPTADYCKEYNRVNLILDKLSELACNFLADAGFKAEAPKATAKTTELDNLNIDVPHKTVARLSGLGWIGKSALLVTDEFGSAVRLTSVFTDALFEYDTPMTIQKCGKCTSCMKTCPGNAILGKNWFPEIAIDNYYKPKLCRQAIEQYRNNNSEVTQVICGICIANCPFTLKYTKEIKNVI